MTDKEIQGFVLQKAPLILFGSIPGDWLLKHSTPSWRIKDPKKGFQRMVKEERARKIAVSVLDQQRTFPNAIVLATDIDLLEDKGTIAIKDKIKFLVVDGQHRLWAQTYSKFVANYACMIHCGLSEIEMAKLFLEINDTQKRVPSSLRWDLVRLVKPKDDPYVRAAAEISYTLATEEKSPLFQRIDLTGEQAEITLKQGSIAPEIKSLLSHKNFKELDYETQYDLLERYITAIKSLDSKGWNDGKTPFYKARILRMLIKLLPEILNAIKKGPPNITASDFIPFLERIDQAAFKEDKIKAQQGVAGMSQIYGELFKQIFKKK